MTAQKGSLFLARIGDGGTTETFTVVGGFRSNGFSINNQLVDVNSKTLPGVSKLLAGAGIQSFAISGSGLFENDAGFAAAHAAAMDKTEDNWQISIPGHGTYQGAFQVASLEQTGDLEGAVQYTIALESSGAITFTSS